MDIKYPARLSVGELRAELDAYTEMRKQKVKSATVDLDRRKVEYFLAWLDGQPAAEERADPDGPFTQNIQEYLVWLEKRTGDFSDMDPNRLAGLAITMYRQYQVSPERRAARGVS